MPTAEMQYVCQATMPVARNAERLQYESLSFHESRKRGFVGKDNHVVQTCRVAGNSPSATAKRVSVDVIQTPRRKAQISCVWLKQGLDTTGIGLPHEMKMHAAHQTLLTAEYV